MNSPLDAQLIISKRSQLNYVSSGSRILFVGTLKHSTYKMEHIFAINPLLRTSP